jgi:hypothetical protein
MSNAYGMGHPKGIDIVVTFDYGFCHAKVI